MRSDKRKAIIVIADRFDRYVPALYAVTAFAIRPELAPMNIGVAIGTVRAHLAEDQAGMTLRAADLLVHAA